MTFPAASTTSSQPGLRLRRCSIRSPWAWRSGRVPALEKQILVRRTTAATLTHAPGGVKADDAIDTAFRSVVNIAGISLAAGVDHLVDF